MLDSIQRSTQCSNCLSSAAEYGCDKCENERFCSECYHNVHIPRIMQKHQRVSLAETASEMIACELHRDEKLKYWCQTCGTLICSDCKHLKHHDHQHDFLFNVTKEFEVKVSTQVLRLYSMIL